MGYRIFYATDANITETRNYSITTAQLELIVDHHSQPLSVSGACHSAQSRHQMMMMMMIRCLKLGCVRCGTKRTATTTVRIVRHIQSVRLSVCVYVSRIGPKTMAGS